MSTTGNAANAANAATAVSTKASKVGASAADAANELTGAASKFFDKHKVAAAAFLKSPGGIVLQVAIGFIVVLLIYWLSVKALRSDSLVQMKSDPNARIIANILAGFAESSQVAKQSYNTVNSYASSYVPLNPSSNIKGGAQFTYSLWLNVGNAANAAGKPIFIRGDSTKYNYTSTNLKTKQPLGVRDYVSFCPMLEFGTNNMDFNVRFNTADNINETLSVSAITTSDSVYRKNMMGLLSGQWFMITLVFEDNIPINDFENGLAVKFYVNKTLYQSAAYPSMLKQNTGNLFLFPEGSIDQCKISNFNYYNYAIGEPDIAANYAAGPSKQPLASVSSSFIQPLALSDYNTLDIYNT